MAKAPSFVKIPCPACNVPLLIERALMVVCPTCAAAVGEPCVDKRSKSGAKSVRVKTHPSRRVPDPVAAA